MRKLLTLPAHPFLFALFPILFLYNHNKGQILLNAIFIPITITLLGTLFLWSLLNFILKNNLKAGLLVSLFLLLFFSYGHFFNALINVYLRVGRFTIGPNKILFPVWIIIFFLGLYFIFKTRQKLTSLTQVLNLIALFLVFPSIISVGVYQYKTRNIQPKKTEVEVFESNETQNQNTPDIYYIILDSYARADILKEIFNYENSDLLEYLSKKGFYIIEKAKSNYCQTTLSLASSLNLEYLDEMTNKVGIENPSHEPLHDMIVHGRVINYLRQQGYLFIAFPSGYWATEVQTADIYIPSESFFDEFQNGLINTTILTAIFKSRNQLSVHRRKVLTTFDHLADFSKKKEPIFVFAHLLVPHPPFIFGPNGEKLYPRGGYSAIDGKELIRQGRVTREEYIKGYVNQLIFINKKIKTTVDEILSKSTKPSIIILQADTGSGLEWDHEDLNNTNLRERFSILNAIYLPDRNYKNFYQKITPVNVFKIIFNQYFGSHDNLLEDKSYFSTVSRPYNFVDVTNRINSPSP